MLAWRPPPELEGVVEEALDRLRNGRGNLADSITHLQELSLEGESQRQIVQLGGIEDVLLAMRAHPNAADIQINGCWALGNIGLRNEEAQSLIMQCGGIEQIYQAMTTFASNPRVQDKGCWAL